MRRMPLIFVLTATFILSLLPAIRVHAQEARGSIQGSVTDISQAVLPGAIVELEPTAKKVNSDSQGQYRITDIAPGQYTLSVSYVGFASSKIPVTVAPAQATTIAVVMQVATEADSVMVSADRLHGEAEAINIERSSDNILQVLPAQVITSLPNTNVADAVGRLPSVTLERDEGEGKYVQIRGTEPRLSNTTVNGINLPSPEGGIRNIKLDIIPSGLIDRIEVSKTLSANQDGDAIGGSVNLVTKSASERPTFEVGMQGGYTPIQEGRWLDSFDTTYGRRLGSGKKLGALLSGTYDFNGRGIDDLEPLPIVGTAPNGNNIAFFQTADLRTYKYYRTRYGFGGGLDYAITPQTNAYVKGLFSDFQDYGDTWVYTPTVGNFIKSVNGTTVTFDNAADCAAVNNTDPKAGCAPGNMTFRHYVRRPDQQIFSILTGLRQNLGQSTILNFELAGSRSHNNGGQSFATTNFNGPQSVDFSSDSSNPRRPKFAVLDGTNIYDPSTYSEAKTSIPYSHTSQINFQGAFTGTRYYSLKSHYGTFELGMLIRNAEKSQTEKDQLYNKGPGAVLLSDVLSAEKNCCYYDNSFKYGSLSYGPLSSYTKLTNRIKTDLAAFGPTDAKTNEQHNLAQTYSGNERIYAGFVQNNINVGKFRIETGLRIEATDATYRAYKLNYVGGNYAGPSDAFGGSTYINVLPSLQLQYLLTPNTNIRAAFGMGISRPNFQDIVPSEQIDPNTTPPSAVKGNPTLRPTKANNYDLLVEHYFLPLGVIQAGFFYKDLSDPIFPTANKQVGGPLDGYRINQSINGPNAYLTGVEAAWEQRLSKLPGALNGLGVSANYSYTTSKVSFPTGFNGYTLPNGTIQGRTDHPHLQRQAPNTWNAGATYDKARFSGRLGISHNDANIYSYNYSVSPGVPLSDPIVGTRGPTGDVYLYAHTQYDVQAGYRLYQGLRMTFAGLNLSNEVFGFYQGSGAYPIQREYYKPSFIFGLRWTNSGERSGK